MPWFRWRTPPQEAMQYVDTLEGRIAMEMWLGDAFESWLPSTKQLLVRKDYRGTKLRIKEGDYLLRTSNGYGLFKRGKDPFERHYEPIEPEHTCGR